MVFQPGSTPLQEAAENGRSGAICHLLEVPFSGQIFGIFWITGAIHCFLRIHARHTAAGRKFVALVHPRISSARILRRPPSPVDSSSKSSVRNK